MELLEGRVKAEHRMASLLGPLDKRIRQQG